MDFQRHPFRTGCIIGLIYGAIRYPGALGCLLLLVLGAVVLVFIGVVFSFLDAMPWSGLAVAAAVGLFIWSRWHGRRDGPGPGGGQL